MRLSLLLLLGDAAGVLLGQSSANGTSLLGSEVEREILLALVENSELVALRCVDDGQYSGNRLAEIVSVKTSRSTYCFLRFIGLCSCLRLRPRGRAGVSRIRRTFC